MAVLKNGTKVKVRTTGAVSDHPASGYEGVVAEREKITRGHLYRLTFTDQKVIEKLVQENYQVDGSWFNDYELEVVDGSDT